MLNLWVFGAVADRRKRAAPAETRAEFERSSAGTESSPVMCGWIDGTIRSGERAAHEVITAEALTVA